LWEAVDTPEEVVMVVEAVDMVEDLNMAKDILAAVNTITV
jgi:hypothetical protein